MASSHRVGSHTRAVSDVDFRPFDTTDPNRAHLDLDHAVNDLRRRRPDLSAGVAAWPWQKRLLFCLFALGIPTAIYAFEQIVFVLAAVLVVPFFCVVALRLAALWQTTTGSAPNPDTQAIEIGRSQLPRYTLLVPIYDEAAVVTDLISALEAIDYPRELLQILIILEEGDSKTRHAVETAAKSPNMISVVVPPGEPRTKPRALNYALRRATGDLVVVYDAEDVPKPDQLKRAAKLLATSPRLGCVQARLNVLNAEENWLTRGIA